MYSNDEDIARFFLFYFSNTYSMFLSKIQHSYSYNCLITYIHLIGHKSFTICKVLKSQGLTFLSQ